MRVDSVETIDRQFNYAVMPGLKWFSCNQMSLNEFFSFTPFYVPGICDDVCLLYNEYIILSYMTRCITPVYPCIILWLTFVMWNSSGNFN